ncbi:MAG: Crp/Fnr family transcriptional regulator [Pseudolabrys sp.]
MPLDEDIAFFEQVPLLALLGEEALRILAIGAESRAVAHGMVLFYAGDLADGGYLVQSGSFLLEPDTLNDGQEKRGMKVGAGTLLGELALVTDTVRVSTATALEPSTVMRIPRSLFLKMLEGYPAAAGRLRDAMAERVDAFSREVESMKSKIDPADSANRA